MTLYRLTGPFRLHKGRFLHDARNIEIGTIYREERALQVLDALNQWWDACGQFEPDEEDPTQEQELRLP